MVEKLNSLQITKKLSAIADWQAIDELFLIRKYKFYNWQDVIDFINKISLIAEKLNHHPNINFTYGFCEIKIQTHQINALSQLDFDLAYQIDQIKS
jgi:4a-hydroxytetrahydrobiopterin dehydratase